MEEEIYGYIYMIENKVNQHKYIGQTARNVEDRIAEHIKFSRYKKFNESRALYQAIRKYGTDNFKWKVIDTAQSQEELDEKESYWISYYNTYLGEGYNMSPGGQIEKKNHADEEISVGLSKMRGGKEFVVYDLKGNFIKEMVSQTVFAEQVGCCVESINNCLKGIKTQIKGYILFYKDEFTEEKLKERMNTRRKYHTFVVFDENDNYIGQWDSMRSCERDIKIGDRYLHRCLEDVNYYNQINKNIVLNKYKCFYIENCPKELLEKISKEMIK
jgi:group I intron endonuclease